MGNKQTKKIINYNKNDEKKINNHLTKVEADNVYFFINYDNFSPTNAYHISDNYENTDYDLKKITINMLSDGLPLFVKFKNLVTYKYHLNNLETMDILEPSAEETEGLTTNRNTLQDMSDLLGLYQEHLPVNWSNRYQSRDNVYDMMVKIIEKMKNIVEEEQKYSVVIILTDGYPNSKEKCEKMAKLLNTIRKYPLSVIIINTDAHEDSFIYWSYVNGYIQNNANLIGYTSNIRIVDTHDAYTKVLKLQKVKEPVNEGFIFTERVFLSVPEQYKKIKYYLLPEFIKNNG